jgi:hypothetical protein
VATNVHSFVNRTILAIPVFPPNSMRVHTDARGRSFSWLFMVGLLAIAAGLILAKVFRNRTEREANQLKRTSQRSSKMCEQPP